MRCGTKLINTGMKKADVWLRCGEPWWRDEYDEAWHDSRDGYFLPHRSEHEIWAYNFGPTQLLRYLHFLNGTLQSIETGEHGFTAGATGNRACQLDQLQDGMHKIDVVRRCGKPDFTDRRHDQRSFASGGMTRSYAITVDEWTYNLGPTRFLTTLVFENGRLTDIQRGERGQ